MLYTGRFINLNNDIIEVNVTTNNSTDSSTELEFAGESPVIITQVSQDGIFSPVKSRSCTITVVTHEEYFDMYTGASHGTLVTVENISQSKRLFYGYMTPCEYNQPLLYLNEIELEAVDALSTLHDFKYQYINHTAPQLVSVKRVIKHCFATAGYTGGIYMQKNALQSKKGYLAGVYPSEMEFVSESIFSDDDENVMTCYEVLEEIGKFYNFSFCPDGNDVYIIDYEAVANYNVFGDSSNYLTFKNLNNGYERNVYIPKNIDIDSYAGDDQNIEIDDVYNKVEVSIDTLDLDSEDILYDPLNDVSEATYVDTYESGAVRTDNRNWTIVTRFFEYVKGSYFPQYDSGKNWQTLHNVNSEFVGLQYRLTDNFTNTQISCIAAELEHPYGATGNILNKIPAQTCLPAQQFSYESSKEMPYSANWNNYMMFFPQAEWLWCYFEDARLQKPDGWSTRDYWLNTFYNEHMGGSKPVLKYWGDKEIEFSPADSSTTNYIAVTGDLLWQQNCTYDDVNYNLWTADTTNRYFGGILAPIKELGASQTHTSDNYYSRAYWDEGYNTGWDMLKIKLKIGDKYWNGTEWTTDDSSAWIPYHQENVVRNSEKLVWSDFNKPVTNHNYTYMIGKDAYVIPITKEDGLFGRVYVEIYMPRIPYSGWVIPPSPIYMQVDYTKTPPAILMRNFSMELVSASNDTEHWYLDFSGEKTGSNASNEEIKYSNTVAGNNVKDFDDLSLKINTYNDKLPNSQSYIIEPTEYQGDPSDITAVNKCVYHTEGFTRPLTDTTERQEMNIVDRYVQHHSTPKKIYNCTVHDYFDPYSCVTVDAIPSTKFVVDQQEYDVKNNVNSLKIIQY